jgi:cation diffusion facilitator family transporter
MTADATSVPLKAKAPRRAGPEERAIRVAIACSIVGTIVKFTMGGITGSMSMISSAVDSLGDLFVSITNLFVVRYGDQPPDDDHNYGHGKVEGLGEMFEGGFIFAAGGFIIYEAVHKMIVGEVSHDSTLGIVVMLPILGMTFATVTYLRKVAKKTGSLVVKSDALHYMTDVWVNLGVLVSLILVKLTGKPVIDSIISVLIALYMLKSSLGIVREGFDVVMDKSLDREVVDKLTATLKGHPAVESVHELKTRGGRHPHVDFHAVISPEMTAKQIHDLFLELQTAVREVVGATTKVHMHADPEDDAGEGDDA